MNFTGALGEAIAIANELRQREEERYLVSCNLEGLEQIKGRKVDVEELAYVIRDYLRIVKNDNDIQIVFKPIKVSNEYLLGSAYNVGSVVEVYYSIDLNTCWQRFVQCKELVQLYIDNDESKSKTISYTPSDIINQLSEVINSQSILFSGDNEKTFDPGFDNEALAFIVAVLVMLPPSDKNLIRFLGHLIDDKTRNITHYDLALMYKTPEIIIKFYRAHLEKAVLLFDHKAV
ncbi:MAG: hypothetical protein KA797_02770 [Chitinophagales bacterium]|nr:hypothetical protein [Chitinophagales bacterium]